MHELELPLLRISGSLPTDQTEEISQHLSEIRSELNALAVGGGTETEFSKARLCLGDVAISLGLAGEALTAANNSIRMYLDTIGIEDGYQPGAQQAPAYDYHTSSGDDRDLISKLGAIAPGWEGDVHDEDRDIETSSKLSREAQSAVRPAEISRVAVGKVVVETDVGAGTPIRMFEGATKAFNNGKQAFGDGWDGSPQKAPNYLRNNIEAPPDDLLEAVAFTPVYQPAREKKRVEVQRPWPLPPRVEEQMINTWVPAGEQYCEATNRMEQEVNFDYVFDSHLMRDELEAPAYPQVCGGRVGSSFRVRAILPQSVADAVRQNIANLSGDERRTYVRELARTLAIERGGISDEAWDHGLRPEGGSRYNRMRPPYESMKFETPLYVLGPASFMPQSNFVVQDRYD